MNFQYLNLLRRACGLTQEKLAKILGCHISTVKYIESGRMDLSESMATRIVMETGVPMEWIRANNPKKPILNRNGKVFQVSDFEERQAELRYSPVGDRALEKSMLGVILRIEELFKLASRSNSTGLLMYKLNMAFDELGVEFTVPESKKKRTKKSSAGPISHTNEDPGATSKGITLEWAQEFIADLREKIDQKVEFTARLSNTTKPLPDK